jgi:dipeptidyl aminopeptidase/acylaminoacyl peptidase
VIDLKKPVYVSARSEWTKENGWVRLDPGQKVPRRLLWGEASFSVSRAPEGNVVLVSRSTPLEFGDYHLTDTTFANLRRITNVNPHLRPETWTSGTMLVDYKGPSGERLQASLFLPPNYQKGKRYPAIVEIYETTSHSRNAFTTPNPDDGAVDPASYAQRGYVIISPDIHYLKDRPGTSALHCVLAAARAAVAAGVVDSTRVGLTGHSWGGYESAFISSQTSFFRAILPGASLTDLISLYGGIYWSIGTAEMDVFESDQTRMTKPPWRDLESYVRESALFHVDRVTTPILLLHNDKDDAVDWHQGIEYYNALRRAGKPVVMLQYVGEGHGVSIPANYKDYAVRMREFFDHYLMGSPAPRWWTEGVPLRKMDDHLRERAGPATQSAEK